MCAKEVTTSQFTLGHLFEFLAGLWDYENLEKGVGISLYTNTSPLPLVCAAGLAPYSPVLAAQVPLCFTDAQTECALGV